MDRELIYSAYLVDPIHKNGKIDFRTDFIDFPKVLGILKENRVQLLYLNRRDPDFWPFFNFPAFRDAERKESERFQFWLNEYRIINRELYQQRIAHILMRSHGHLPYLEDSLDIIVRKADIVSARKIIEKQGFDEDDEYKDGSKFIYRKLCNGDSFGVNLLHPGSSDLKFMDEKLVWRKVVRNLIDNMLFWTFDSGQVVLMNLAQMVCRDSVYHLPRAIRTLRHLAKVNGSWGYLAETARNRGWQKEFYSGVYALAKIEEHIFDTVSLNEHLMVEANRHCRRSIKGSVNKSVAQGLQMPLHLKRNLGGFLGSLI